MNIPIITEDMLRKWMKGVKEKFDIEIEVLEPGNARGTLPLQGQPRNHYGIPFGGVLFNLADNTAGMAFMSAGGNGVTASASVSFMRAAAPKAEKLICHASVKKSGRKLYYVSAEISDDTGQTLTDFDFIFANVP